MMSPWLQDHHLQYLKLRSGLSPDQAISRRGRFTAERPHTCAYCQKLKIREMPQIQSQDMWFSNPEYSSTFQLEPRVDFREAIEGAKTCCELLIWMADHLATQFSLTGLAAKVDQTYVFGLTGSGSMPRFRLLLSSEGSQIDLPRSRYDNEVLLDGWTTGGK